MLGSANADEHNRGYNDRYDCSAADVNPIGSADKALVREVLRWCATALGAPVLLDVAEATPLSETEPEEDDATDEADMGLSYPMLSRLSSLRKAARRGPLGAYLALRDGLSPEAEVEMARQVRHAPVLSLSSAAPRRPAPPARRPRARHRASARRRGR